MSCQCGENSETVRRGQPERLEVRYIGSATPFRVLGTSRTHYVFDVRGRQRPILAADRNLFQSLQDFEVVQAGTPD
jgi:hypothetical protein